MDKIQHASLLSTYAADISAWKGRLFLDGDMLERLTLKKHNGLSVVYAPFDYVQLDAKIIIVGITPGRVQAENAFTAARAAISAGKSILEASRIAKLEGSFSGPMRRNLVAMLDHIGINQHFGIAACDKLFADDSTSIHFTSALRYPVFLNGQNYNGQPDMLRTPLLRKMIDTYLQAEAKQIPSAIWLPLGPKPTAAVNYLVEKGGIEKTRVLTNMPHPSGANAERVAYFLGNKLRSALSSKTRAEPLEIARKALITQVSQMEKETL